jgi:hypothetical protein
VTVTTPSGEKLAVKSDELRERLEAHSGREIFLLYDTEVDQRCMMITLDPTTAKPSPSVLRCVAQHHNQCAGVYATVLTPGEVRIGDTVWIEA